MPAKGYSHSLRLLSLVLVLGRWSSALRLTNMTAPALQDPRRDMHLHCRFDMGGEELLNVKWYKDDHEFYRYTPRDSEMLRSYEVAGVRVDSSRSRCDRTACDIVLKTPRRPHSSGAYRCEVSTEAPTFRLASQTQNVTVAALPRELPVIEGLKDSYSIGELIQAKCTSGWGDPKPILTWYIDNKKVPSKESSPTRDSSNELRINLTSTTSHIQHQLSKSLAHNKHSTPLEIRCESSVEEISPSLAPPLATTKTVMVLDPAQVVNNQKLHWPDSAGSRCRLEAFWMAVAVSVIGWC